MEVCQDVLNLTFRTRNDLIIQSLGKSRELDQTAE